MYGLDEDDDDDDCYDYFGDGSDDYFFRGDGDDIYNLFDACCGDFEDYESSEDYSAQVNIAEARENQRFRDFFKKLRKSREEETLTDGEIQVEEQKFKIHKLILQASSSYFEAMFTGPFNEKDQKCIVLQGVTKDVFSLVLDFLYGERIDLQEKTVQEVYLAADMFCIDALTTECIAFLEENWRLFESKANALAMADMFKLTKVREDILQEMGYLMGSSTDEKFKSEFNQCPYTFLKSLLQSNCLENNNVIQNLVKLLVDWISHDPKERLLNAEDILTQLKLNQFPWANLELLEGKIVELLDQEQMQELKKSFQETFRSQCKAIKEAITQLGIRICVTAEETKDKSSVSICDLNCSNWQWRTSATLQLPFKINTTLIRPNSNEVYLIGDSQLSSYNPNSKGCNSLKPLTPKRLGFSSCFLGNDLYVAGGHSDNIKSKPKMIVKYQTERDQWRNMINWRSPKTDSSILGHDNCIYLVGGIDKNDCHVSNFLEEKSKVVFKYTPLRKTFHRLCKFNNEVNSSFLVVYENTLYVFPYDLYFNFTVDNIETVNILSGQVAKCPIKWKSLRGKRLIGVHSVPTGIVLALTGTMQKEDQVFLVLFKPNEELIKLGYLPRLPVQLETSNNNIGDPTATRFTWFCFSSV